MGRAGELVLRQGEREAVFQRSPEQARWFPRGSDEEVAFEFYDVLERLLFLDAAAWTDRPAPSGEPLVVTLRRPQQGDVVLELLAIPQGALVVGRGARVGGDLFEDLRALLQ